MTKHKAKILVFSPWYRPHIGGLESHAEQFNAGLVQRGYQILVVTPLSSAGGSSQEVVSPSLTILRFPAMELIAKYPAPRLWHPQWLTAWRAALAFKPDIVISRTRFFSTTAVACWYHHRTGRPWLHIEHGADFVHFDSPSKRRIARLYDHTVSRWLLRRANRIVANSDASAHFAGGLAGRDDIQKIYRGVPHQQLQAIAPAKREAAIDQKIVIAYIGRLIDGKGVPLLLEALVPLKDSPIHCFIIGNGPQAKKLHALARRLGLSRHLTFLPHLSWVETIAHLKMADICVNPSYSEGLPTSLIEAALCSTAIVATDVGGTREVVSDQVSGLLVPAGNEAALTAALTQLVNDPGLRHRLSQEAQRTVSQKFLWDASINQYEQLFSAMVRV